MTSVVIPVVSSLSQDAQLRFSPALRNAKYGANPTEMDMILYDIKSIDKQVCQAVVLVGVGVGGCFGFGVGGCVLLVLSSHFVNSTVVL